MKKWYQSKTIWGIIIAFLGFLLTTVLQVDISLPESADYDTILKHVENLRAAQNNVMLLLSEGMAFVGTILAIYGRFKAEEKLTK
jgi:hypothetical protein